MKQSVFKLKIENGEFRIVPFMVLPEENITTPKGYRDNKKKVKKK